MRLECEDRHGACSNHVPSYHQIITLGVTSGRRLPASPPSTANTTNTLLCVLFLLPGACLKPHILHHSQWDADAVLSLHQPPMLSHKTARGAFFAHPSSLCRILRKYFSRDNRHCRCHTYMCCYGKKGAETQMMRVEGGWGRREMC